MAFTRCEPRLPCLLERSKRSVFKWHTVDKMPGGYSLELPIRGGSAPKGYLFQASGQHERVGIPPVELFERIGKSVI